MNEIGKAKSLANRTVYQNYYMVIRILYLEQLKLFYGNQDTIIEKKQHYIVAKDTLIGENLAADAKM